MARHDSGTFRRADRVEAKGGISVRLMLAGRSEPMRAELVELGMSDLLLAGAAPLALGTRVNVGITLPARYLEFELAGMVSWHKDGQFGISFELLSQRQTYGLVLAIDLLSRALESAPARFSLSAR